MLPVSPQADPRHRAGRSRRVRDVDGGGAGDASSSPSWCSSCRAATSTRCTSDRVVTLTGLYKRKRFQDKETGNRFLNELAARMEFRPVTQDEYDRVLASRKVQSMARKASETLGTHAPALGRGALHRGDRSGQEGLRRGRARHRARRRENIELFRPFIFDNSYIFRADNIRALRDRMPRRRSGAAGAGGRRTSTATTTG